MCKVCDKIKRGKTKLIVAELDAWHRRCGDDTSYACFDEEDIEEMRMANYQFCPACGAKI